MTTYGKYGKFNSMLVLFLFSFFIFFFFSFYMNLKAQMNIFCMSECEKKNTLPLT